MKEKTASISFVYLHGETEVYICRSNRKYKGAYRIMNMSSSYRRIMRIRDNSENCYNRWYIFPK